VFTQTHYFQGKSKFVEVFSLQPTFLCVRSILLVQTQGVGWNVFIQTHYFQGKEKVR
jgi:hypothetical protein